MATEQDWHTSGPWSVIDNSWKVSTVYGPSGEIVAECLLSNAATEETLVAYAALKEANARLIAAAPDLLEALREILGPLNVCSDNHNVRDDQVLPVDITMGELRRARAAIARATGEA